MQTNNHQIVDYDLVLDQGKSDPNGVGKTH